MRFGTEALDLDQKAKVAFISTARRRCPLNPAQLIKIMEFLYRRHPKIRMPVQLLIKPGRSAFVGSDTQEIGSRAVSTRAFPFLMRAVAGATITRPGPSHARYLPVGVEKSRTSKAAPVG